MNNKRPPPDILSILAGKWIFSTIFVVLFFYVHFQLSRPFLDLQSLEVNLLQSGINLITVFPKAWKVFRIVYLIVCALGLWLAGFVLYRTVFEGFLNGSSQKEDTAEYQIPEFIWTPDKLQMIVGLRHNKKNIVKVPNPTWMVVPEKGMFQNFLISGTIGMGKTACVMYPFVKQALFYKAHDNQKKAGMLILDVKGNFYEQVLTFADECGRKDDVVLIELGGEYKYNPLHKPGMEAVDLAGRSRTVMELFTGGGKKEAFWDTKSGQMMCECIRLMRMVNNGYVTLSDIQSLVTDSNFLDEKLNDLYSLEEKVHSGEISEFDYNSAIRYFSGEFNSKAEETIETIKACVTEMTAFFASSQRIHDSFCPPVEELSFFGFEEAVNLGKIVVLAMNVAEQPVVAKTIAAYLKLDFQSEIQRRTVSSSGLNRTRPMFFICDEYQYFVTSNDADFYGVSRESRCCSIVATQSYTSLLKTLGDDKAQETLQQNLINKIWLRSDDKRTIDTAQLLTGKEEKRKVSKNISESAGDAKKSRLFGRMVAEKASVSEGITYSTQRDFVFEASVFTQVIEVFTGVAFLAGDKGMQEPSVVHLLPYFESPIKDEIVYTHSDELRIKL